jgi:hypothetical protein
VRGDKGDPGIGIGTIDDLANTPCTTQQGDASLLQVVHNGSSISLSCTECGASSGVCAPNQGTFSTCDGGTSISICNNVCSGYDAPFCFPASRAGIALTVFPVATLIGGVRILFGKVDDPQMTVISDNPAVVPPATFRLTDDGKVTIPARALGTANIAVLNENTVLKTATITVSPPS